MVTSNEESEQETTSKGRLLPTILDLMLQSKVFVRCPGCSKGLGIFEVYNESCAFCGPTSFSKMIVIRGLGGEDAKDEED